MGSVIFLELLLNGICGQDGPTSGIAMRVVLGLQ